MVRTLLRQARRRLERPYVSYKGLRLPPKSARFCGQDFGDDAYFVRSAERQVELLIERCGLSGESMVLDVGCGAGRLAIGIIAKLGRVRHYQGIDVDKRSIEWCQRHIGDRHAGFDFMHINAQNERYNPAGELIKDEFAFPFLPGTSDIIFLYSVFSHMEDSDIRVYLKEFARLLKPEGKLYLTAFIEENVPPMSVNPEGYRRDWSNALHCVRFERGYFEELLAEAGLRLSALSYATETDGQSALTIERMP